MIENLMPYSDFNPTGLPWLERIPAHWSLVPNRALVRRRKVLVGHSHHQYVLLSLTKQGIIVRDVASGKGKFSSDMGTSQEVRVGDLVFCFFDVPETPRTVGLSTHHGMITSAYTVLEPLQPRTAPYFELFYRAMDDSKLLSPIYSGLRNTIPIDRFLGTKTPQPPSEEQAAIVRFLDHAGRRIDQFIRAKKKLIALLNEQKQAIIQRAVTRGLNPNVPLRESGVPGLGAIPEHWKLPLNQRIFKEEIRPHYGQPETQLSLSQQDGLVAKADLRERSLQTSTFDNWKVVTPGDLVLNRFKAHLGVFFAAKLRGIVSFHYGVFAPRVALCSEYFELLFHTAPYRAIYAGRSNGMTVGLQNLSNQNFYCVRAILPPEHEQRDIVEFCRRSTAGLDRSIAMARREIVLLQEYRARLLADVVTGQFDVRAAAAAIPDVEAPSTAAVDNDEDSDESEAA